MTSTTTSSSEQDLLQAKYIFQHAKTGKTSSQPMTVQQLFKLILSTSFVRPRSTTPGTPTSDDAESTTQEQQQQQQGGGIVARVLSLTDSGQYATTWQTLEEVPVLKYTTVAHGKHWYCTLVVSSNNKDEGKGNQQTKTDAAAKVIGPLTLMELAQKYSQEQQTQSISQIWNPLKKAWSSISQIDLDLEACLLALQHQHQEQQEQQRNLAATSNHNQPDAAAVQDELQDFLNNVDAKGTNEDQEEYLSDGGTRYIKDVRTGRWLHEALFHEQQQQQQQQGRAQKKNGKKRKRDQKEKDSDKGNAKQSDDKKNKESAPQDSTYFSTKASKNWIYVTGLPQDITLAELQQVFGKAGIFDLDPRTLQPKIKLYYQQEQSSSLSGEGDNNDDKNREQSSRIPKGDASLCYARPESVNLAIQLFDQTPLRFASQNHNDDKEKLVMKVERAKFQQKNSNNNDDNKNDKNNDKKKSRRPQQSVSQKQRKVARLAARQAVGWDEDDNGRITGGHKGLTIVVLKNLFTRDEIIKNKDKEDAFLATLQQDLQDQVLENINGRVEKLTFFPNHPEGVAIVKLAQAFAASELVHQWGNSADKTFRGRNVTAQFWDGVTDYSISSSDPEKEEQEEQARHDEFGKWLQDQELPDELKLQVQTS